MDFIVDHEATWAYLSDGTKCLILLALFLLTAGVIFLVMETIAKVKDKNTAKRSMEKVRKCGIDAVDPTVGLIALRNDIKLKLEECQAAEEEFRKILSEIDEELEEVRLAKADRYTYSKH